jgi:hypothetical protein
VYNCHFSGAKGPVERAVGATGMSMKTVTRIRKEQRDKGYIESPVKRRRKERSGPVQSYTENFQERIIRRRIHNSKLSKFCPQTYSLHAVLVEGAETPYSRTSLYRSLSGF